MAAVEDEVRKRGRLLVPGISGYRLYRRAGATEGGTIPDDALFRDRRLCDAAGF